MSASHSSSGDFEIGNTRNRIIAAASKLVTAGGEDAATTRAVAEAASVQAPTIYRLFGDKRGLLDAVAEEAFAKYVEEKASREPAPDPVEDLQRGWNDHIAFGLAYPAVFALITTSYTTSLSRAAAAGIAVLREKVRRVARTGRLRVAEERAVDLLHAAGVGTVLSLLAKAPDERGDLADALRETVFAKIVGEGVERGDVGPSGSASALRASLDEVGGLTPGERLILDELLQRISSTR